VVDGRRCHGGRPRAGAIPRRPRGTWLRFGLRFGLRSGLRSGLSALAHVPMLWQDRYIPIDSPVRLPMASLPRLDLANLRLRTDPVALARAVPFPASTPPLLIGKSRVTAPAVPVVPRRTRLWELSSHLHCSIIGTCLSTAELRQALAKTKPTADVATEHELHGMGVTVAGLHDAAAKLLHKALDKRHHLTLRQFEKAKTVEELRALWRAAVKHGDIPGAYWAVLTHAVASDQLVREVFGEVHMLSHLVGAANRADIRRLSRLEAENAELRTKAQRQQDQLRDGIASRDTRIRDLSALLARKVAEAANTASAEDAASEQATLTRLVGELERRLTAEGNRRANLERRAERLADELRQEREQRGAAAQRERALREELEAIEATLAAAPSRQDEDAAIGLAGLALLYVGGRPGALIHLRALAEQLGAAFLHHDGGIEDRGGLIAGLIHRADVVMFPVDCVSHAAVGMVKRLCRQAGKPYLPLRSAGVGSFMAALGRAAIIGAPQAARLQA